MKKFLFRTRRSGWLHGLILVLLSVLGSLTAVIAGLVYIMFRFGLEQPDLSASDRYGLINWLEMQNVDYDNAYSFFMTLRPILVEIAGAFPFYGMLILLYFGFLLLLLYLIACAGYHGQEKSPSLRGIERIPYDLLLPVMITGISCIFMEVHQILSYSYYLEYILIGSIGWLAALTGSFLLLLMITAAQLRTGTLFSGMLLARGGRLLFYFVRRIPDVWKATAIWGGILFFIYWFVFLMYNETRWYYEGYGSGLFGIFWVLIMLTLFFGGLWVILQMDAIRKKARMLAEGKLTEKVQSNPSHSSNQEFFPESPTAKKKNLSEIRRSEKRISCPLLPAFQSCLQDLDRISDGMNIAVEEKMKSERFQTELITNVSHDIKTPLTSIINYLDFLSQEEKKENRNPQVVREYMEVLDRQSVRLKKLIEDLIEASKASTGSLNIEKEPCELGIFLQQIAGEYEERLEKAQLTLNLALPEERIYVEADGRYLWRVVDNLLQNACKYAMTCTRVYLQLQETAGQAIITMKNISASELNIPAEELMERFVRGDRSRHSEGSGLGLSIAKSLTELQGGKFAIEIDGDLFKTTIAFPVSQKNEA